MCRLAPQTLPRRSSSSSSCQDSCVRLVFSVTLWICVLVTFEYGYYGSSHMVLGPSSSRLVKASSLFVQQVEARDDARKGVFLYGFSQKPDLSSETNWTVSNYFIVGSYNRRGFSLWLNNGSSVRLRWKAQASSLSSLMVFLLKGEQKSKPMLPTHANSSDLHTLGGLIKGKEAEYKIEGDDRYHVDILNMNARSIILEMHVDVRSKMYDTTNAKSMCSTINGSCQLDLPFHITQFVILTTPNSGDLSGYYVELSFVARVITYVAILGFIVIFIFLVLKYLGVYDGDRRVEQRTAPEVMEREHLIPEKRIQYTYGTGEEDEETGSYSGTSDDLYDGKICVICYDNRRDCFFVPCGHCATCYECAQRIMVEQGKVCPICRRLIHKVRKLFNP